MKYIWKFFDLEFNLNEIENSIFVFFNTRLFEKCEKFFFILTTFFYLIRCPYAGCTQQILLDR